jgi:hypothetical protein
LATDDLRASTDITLLTRVKEHMRLSCSDQPMQAWDRASVDYRPPLLPGKSENQ